MATEQKTEQAAGVHGGRLVAKRLKAHGVTKLFTLSGGHIFSIFDGCREEGIDIVDTRHEQSAAFAAEGWAKATRQTGVCALTAGPGVTNGMSPMGSALQNGSPMVVLGGRAPAMRWGQGSLQEIDHVPFAAPLTRSSATVESTAEIPAAMDATFAAAAGPPSGPAFLDFPLDHVFMESDADADAPVDALDHRALPAAEGTEQAIELLRGAQRPVDHGRHRPLLGPRRGRSARPGRGAADPRVRERARPRLHPGRPRARLLARARQGPQGGRRGPGGRGADGLPAGLRRLVRRGHRDRGHRLGPSRPRPRASAGRWSSTAGCPPLSTPFARAPRGGPDRSAWVGALRETETEKRAGEQEELTDDRAPLHPLRVYNELAGVLDRDTVVIGDGGDFVSYAGRVIETYEPGCWMDPGPFGCLGSGPGYALAAKLANPDRQVCLLMGDGAFGFGGMEFDTLVRHGVPVVAVMGNNGIWGLEKHPMEFLYGYSVAAELQPECRYDQVVEALGGHGELVERPDELRPALERAFASGRPALVNVLTDPAIAYPRRSNLA